MNEWSYNLRRGGSEKGLPDAPVQMGGWAVGYTILEFWGEVRMKMEIWLLSESGRCPTSQDWINSTRK